MTLVSVVHGTGLGIACASLRTEKWRLAASHKRRLSPNSTTLICCGLLVSKSHNQMERPNYILTCQAVVTFLQIIKCRVSIFDMTFVDLVCPKSTTKQSKWGLSLTWLVDVVVRQVSVPGTTSSLLTVTCILQLHQQQYRVMRGRGSKPT